jgi:hypothetical protein
MVTVIINVVTQGRTLFLGAIAQLGKATINFIMSVRLYARVERLGCHWMDFYEV